MGGAESLSTGIGRREHVAYTKSCTSWGGLQSAMQDVRGKGGAGLERGHKKLKGNGVPHEGITWVNWPLRQQIIGNNEEQLQVGDWKQCNWVPLSENLSEK